MNKTFYLTIIFSFIISFTCNTKKEEHTSSADRLIGKKINPMIYSSIPFHLIDSIQFREALAKPFKIFVAGNYYCAPCRYNFLKWEDHYNDFKKYKNTSILFYLYITREDFKKNNLADSINFPIIIDFGNRFHNVNNISSRYNEQVFLTDKNNKIIAVGQPFDFKTKQTYLHYITGH